jgi:NAD(P)-dependent dehydrogenase (short-subunit alcohol dehydrogenase family)
VLKNLFSLDCPSFPSVVARALYFQKMKIEGSVIIVTGGASGLGEGVARDLVKRGARVSILDLNDENGKKVSEELGANCIFIQTDITKEGTSVKYKINE